LLISFWIGEFIDSMNEKNTLRRQYDTAAAVQLIRKSQKRCADICIYSKGNGRRARSHS